MCSVVYTKNYTLKVPQCEIFDFHDFHIIKRGGGGEQGVTKRCRLSWLTNGTLVYDEPNEEGGDGVTALRGPSN